MHLNLHCSHPRIVIGSCPVTDEYIRFIRSTKQLNGKVKRQVVELALKYQKIPILVPCGECQQCRWEKQKQWMSRLNMETSIALRDGWKCFYTTLTISPDFYPVDDHTQSCKEWYADKVGHFLARLRAKRGGNLKFRYFASCEFGDNYGRFHIHFAFFVKNFEVVPDVHKMYFPYKVTVGKRKDGKTRLQEPDEVNFHHFLERYWGYGFVEKTSWLNASTCMYITKYISKVKEDKLNDKIPFHRQSLGLGIQWIRDHEYEIATGLAKFSPCRIDNDKYTFRIPRYYRVKCERKYGTFYKNAQEYAKKAWDICLNNIRVSSGNVPCRLSSIIVPNKYGTSKQILHSMADLPTQSIHIEYDYDGSIEDVLLLDDEFSRRYYVGSYIPAEDLVDCVPDPDMPSDIEFYWINYFEEYSKNNKVSFDQGVFVDAPVDNLL